MPTVSPDLVEFRFDFTTQRTKTKRPKNVGFLDNIAYSNLCHDWIFAECQPSALFFPAQKKRRHPVFPFPYILFFVCASKFILTEIFYPFIKAVFFVAVVVCPKCPASFSFVLLLCDREFVFSLNHICHIWINKMNEHTKSQIANKK